MEEEFLLIGADGVTAGVAPRVLGPDDGDALTAQADGEVGAELNREQLETGSAPHTSSGVSWSRPGCWWTDWWNGSARRS